MVTTLWSGCLSAAPEEIQVYLDDLTEPRHFGLDVHQNYALEGLGSADYPGQRPADRVYRLTPEFYYGIAPSLELGAYVLSTLDRANHYAVDGEKFRLKYIAPHDETAGAFWGVNLEVGRSDRALEAHPWNYEIKGIYGVRQGRWLWAFNLNVDAALSSQAGAATAELDTKIAYSMAPKTQVGVELYDGLGALSHPGNLSGQNQAVYLVLDSELGACDLNFGIGRGLTGATDPWVVKLILGFHF
jgi:hypothetical protein